MLELKCTKCSRIDILFCWCISLLHVLLYWRIGVLNDMHVKSVQIYMLLIFFKVKNLVVECIKHIIVTIKIFISIYWNEPHWDQDHIYPVNSSIDMFINPIVLMDELIISSIQLPIFNKHINISSINNIYAMMAEGTCICNILNSIPCI
jgi:hypothetical protein